MGEAGGGVRMGRAFGKAMATGRLFLGVHVHVHAVLCDGRGPGSAPDPLAGKALALPQEEGPLRRWGVGCAALTREAE